MRYKQIPPKYAARMFYGGIILLAVGVGLSLYSVPGIPEGNPALALPSFPFLEMRWSPIPVLLILGTVLMAGGWISWRHSIGPIMIIAVGLFIAGVISEVIGFIYAITFTVGGSTVYLLPYGSQPLELILSGIEVGFFSILFSWVDYRAENQRKLRIKIDSTPS